MRERELFIECLQRDDDAERLSYLAAACGGDAALRHRMDRLLEEHARPERFILDSPPPGISEDVLCESEPCGSSVGPYKLLEQIGEGGMGVVYMAEQQSPVRRKVALKIVKPGMDSRQVIARFEAERQALALMDHPNIARVFDAGMTSGGRPYFVMELVEGVPITQYCDDHQLPPRERLELFLPVCHAIQHAHQKGIIHRDLKPTNVLVAEYVARPVAKVIDFGVAKAIGEPLTERTLLTSLGQMVGTIEYMSPEQAELNQIDIDTRSDVYSLGVLLYELLTGVTPHDRKRLRNAAFDEMLRIVRDEEPIKPSARLASVPNLDDIAAKRQIATMMLTRLIRGDLDWITMKSLDKDRTRRYETANGLARDIERYLNKEAVHARPPSAAYRFQKFVQRNVAAFVVASVVAVGIMLAAIGLAVSNYLIREEQARTNTEMDRAERSRVLAEQRAEEIRQGLERLKAANTQLEQGRAQIPGRHWDDAQAAFSKAVELRPDHASAWNERGELYAGLGLWELAAADFTREFALREPVGTIRWYRLALLQLSLGDRDGFRRLRDRMCQRFQGTFDRFSASEVVRTGVLADDSSFDFRPLAALAALIGSTERITPFEQYIVGTAMYRTGDYREAIARLQASLAVDLQLVNREMAYPVLAMAHHRLGEKQEARAALDKSKATLDRWTRIRYESQGNTRWVVDQGATAIWPVAWWDWLEFNVYLREATLMIEGTSSLEDPRFHVLRARSFAGLRAHETASREFATAFRLGLDDPAARLEAHRCAGYIAVKNNDWNGAASAFGAAGELAPNDAVLACFQAVALAAAGNLDEYRRTCRAMVDRFENTTNPVQAGNVLIACTLKSDAIADPARLLRLADVGDRAWHLGFWVRGGVYYRAGKYEECVRTFVTAAKHYRPRTWEWAFLAMAHHRLGHDEEARNCLREATRWIKDADRQMETEPSDVRPTWGSWHERVVYPMLLDEAVTLIGED